MFGDRFTGLPRNPGIRIRSSRNRRLSNVRLYIDSAFIRNKDASAGISGIVSCPLISRFVTAKTEKTNYIFITTM
jgi:hypothetical protein